MKARLGAAAALISSLWLAAPRAGAIPSPSHRPPTHSADLLHEESAALTGMAEPPGGRLVLWYRQPARRWTEALPVGNGRLGAMIYGGVAREDLQLNEDTIWEGFRRDDLDNPAALPALPEIRRLLFADRSREANRLIEEKMISVPPRIRPYQPLGDLDLEFPGLKSAQNYRRELDLDTGIAAVRYESGGAAFTREIFASAPDNLIAVRFACDRPGRIGFRLTLTRAKDARVAADPADPRRLILRGRIMAQYSDDPRPVPALRFEGQALVIPTGGAVTAGEGGLQVVGADSVVLLVAGASDYRGGDPDRLCRETLARGAAKSWADLRTAHVRDFQGLFRRVDLDLGTAGAAVERLPTDERLKRAAAGGADPGLVAAYFQYGRYLLIGSSRPGSLPANLQGLWNDEMQPELGDSDYHLNINLEMNYWPAEVCNLAECHEPLFDFMDTLVAPGTRTARVEYGARGWVVHHLTDEFGFTASANGPVGLWPMGAAWLAQDPWEHYEFSRDRAFLAQRAYPLMRGAARFIIDFLVPAPAGTPIAGRLVTAPSVSPENRFQSPDGSVAAVTYGATMDLEIIHDLLTHCIEASRILRTDGVFRAECESTLARLAPLPIGRDGRLQEWPEEYVEFDPHHRHTSHLFAVYPGDEITPAGTPKLAAAARQALLGRGDRGATEWSLAWRMCLWARLRDAERAYGQLSLLVSRHLYPNLFDRYPPFQIDGNFGAAAGIAEMLLQSQHGEISLLPALPSAWPDGHVRGLRARGAFTVDLAWRHGELTEAVLRSSAGEPARIRTSRPLRVFAGGREIAVAHPEAGVMAFLTGAGGTYLLHE